MIDDDIFHHSTYHKECVSDIRQWLDYNHILLNEAKTEAIVFRSTAVHSPSSLSNICVCGSSISLSLTVRDIGVSLDSRLDMSARVSNVCRSAYPNLFRIAKIRTSLTTAACKTLVHALVTSRLDCGNEVLYGISDRLLHRLEMVQRLERYGRRSFSRAGLTLWNALPEALRSTVCMNKFKPHLKTYYFKIAFNVSTPFTLLYFYLFTYLILISSQLACHFNYLLINNLRIKIYF